MLGYNVAEEREEGDITKTVTKPKKDRKTNQEVTGRRK